MTYYMVEVNLPNPFTEEFINLIPQQRAFINSLLEKGTVAAYSLSLSSSKLWVTFLCNSADEAEALLQQFPVIDFITYTIYDLAFHNTADIFMPAISLN